MRETGTPNCSGRCTQTIAQRRASIGRRDIDFFFTKNTMVCYRSMEGYTFVSIKWPYFILSLTREILKTIFHLFLAIFDVRPRFLRHYFVLYRFINTNYEIQEVF